MKMNQLVKSAVLSLAVLLASSAFAGNSNKGSLHLSEAAQINGQSVPAGDYQLRWEGNGPDVEVSFMSGKKLVTKSAAKVVALKGAPNNDAAVVDKSGSTPSITEVRFAGKKFALAIGSGEKAAMGESTK
jgi:hypothetical protein